MPLAESPIRYGLCCLNFDVLWKYKLPVLRFTFFSGGQQKKQRKTEIRGVNARKFTLVYQSFLCQTTIS